VPNNGELIPLDRLSPADSPRLDGQDAGHVRVLAELVPALPPIIVHRPTMRVIDGMHRVRAASLRGETHVRVVFFEGTPEEAFLLAVRSNSGHGLPLSHADRVSAAARIARAYPQWSHASIASVVGVSDKTVAAIRERSTSKSPRLNSRVGQDGRARPVNPADGRLRASAFIAENPDAALREIAEVAGIAVGTAKDVRDRLRKGQDPLPPRMRRVDGTVHRRTVRGTARLPEQGVRAHSSSTVRFGDLLASLKRDPSLRLNESGRVMLRLFEAHALDEVAWERLIASVPNHCTPTMVDAAQQCMDTWRRFAERLKARPAD
jgi:ParB-like chromosome segregation protein Spo0J